MNDTFSHAIERGGKRFAHHHFPHGNELVVSDYRAAGLGFSGKFYLKSEGDSRLPLVAVGECPGEVYTKLARLPALAGFAANILALPLCQLDYCA